VSPPKCMAGLGPESWEVGQIVPGAQDLRVLGQTPVMSSGREEEPGMARSWGPRHSSLQLAQKLRGRWQQ
jgi:hypothetical protein